jgi:NADH-quinone oxidoreductase subunit I
MFFNIIEKVIRVTKAFTEPRIATKDVTHETMHHSPIFRGKHEIRYDICTGCEACAKICPVDAIIMEPLPIKRPKALPEVNLGICIFCGLCEDVCPTKPEKAIKLSGGTFEMITDGTDKAIKEYWVKCDVPEEWIQEKKKEEEEKARKKAEMMAKKKAEAEAKKKAEAEAKAKADAQAEKEKPDNAEVKTEAGEGEAK